MSSFSSDRSFVEQATLAARRHARMDTTPPPTIQRFLGILGIGAAATALTWFGAIRLYNYWRNRPTIKKSILQTPNSTPVAAEVFRDLENNNVSGTAQRRPAVKVVLHQCPRGYFTPCVAPFPFKLETFVRVANIPYEIDFSAQSKPNCNPATWMTIGSEEIVESHECLPRLCETFGIDLEKSPNPPNRLTASRLAGVVLDNHIYWGIALWRWVYDQGNSIKNIQPLTTMTPDALNEVAESVIRASWYHGFGRLTQDDVVGLILTDLEDLSAALGSHEYFLGREPGQVDCSAFAMLAQMLWNMPNSPFEAAIKNHANLHDFVWRMRHRFWPDWDKVLAKRGDVKQTNQAYYPIKQIQPLGVQIQSEEVTEEHQRRMKQEKLDLIEQRVNQTLLHQNPANLQNFIQSTSFHNQEFASGFDQNQNLTGMYGDQLQYPSDTLPYAVPAGQNHHGYNNPFLTNEPLQPDYMFAGNDNTHGF